MRVKKKKKTVTQMYQRNSFCIFLFVSHIPSATIYFNYFLVTNIYIYINKYLHFENH